MAPTIWEEGNATCFAPPPTSSSQGREDGRSADAGLGLPSSTPHCVEADTGNQQG